MGSIAVDQKILFSSKTRDDQRFAIKTGITDASALDAGRVTLKMKDLVINGFVSQNSLVANFRNLQYAKIPGRWCEAVPVDPTKEKGIMDATQWGPRPPQFVDVLHDATKHLYPRMSTFDRQSEFECLNLNVYTPLNALGTMGRGLPVLVWIHGGAFKYGDGGCEFDGQYLVRNSIDLGEPLLVVGLNYRLGVLGFFSSKQLREEARARGETGFSNLGLHDQRIALQWIQKYIHFFGGDGSRLTVAGESAGASSILAHLRGQVPLFQNAFMMSPAMVTPVSFDESQKGYDQIVAELGLSDAPASQQLSALRSVPALELEQLAAKITSILTEDSEFFCDWNGQQWEEISVIPSWIQRLIIGETKEECVLFSQRWVAMSAEEMYNEWDELYPDKEYYEEVLAAYGINNNPTQAELVSAHVAYTGDAIFSKAVLSLGKTHLQSPHISNPKVFLYSFDQPDIISPNPVFYTRAYHSLDNAFLFYFPQVAGPAAPAEFRATAGVFSGAALKVTNGKDPWEDVAVAKRFMSICAEMSGMKEQTESCHKRLEKLVDTVERREKFKLGIGLVHKAMRYAMILPVDTHT